MNIQDRLITLAAQPFVDSVSLVATRRGNVVMFEGKCQMRAIDGSGPSYPIFIQADGATAPDALDELRKAMLRHLTRGGTNLTERAAAAARAVQVLTGLASLPTDAPVVMDPGEVG